MTVSVDILLKHIQQLDIYDTIRARCHALAQQRPEVMHCEVEVERRNKRGYQASLKVTCQDGTWVSAQMQHKALKHVVRALFLDVTWRLAHPRAAA